MNLFHKDKLNQHYYTDTLQRVGENAVKMWKMEFGGLMSAL